MTPAIGRSRRSTRAVLAALVLVIALPASALGWAPPPTSLVVSSGLIPGVTFTPLINSGDVAFGDTFEGIPDGIGVVPGKKHWPTGLPVLGHPDWIDLYVNHEQSHVPFGGFADFQDSSVTRVRVDPVSHAVIDMEVVLPSGAGFIRFCSATMAGPREGFPIYTLFLNEESNDQLPVPAGAVYGPDAASLGANRQAGYSVWLNTLTGKYGVMAGAGRFNHENTAFIPGAWWGKTIALSGDDTFTTPSTEARPNFSQLYLDMGRSFLDFTRDKQTLWAFRVTATQNGAVNPADPFNDANDFLEIAPGQTWKGEFIPVPDAIARGTTADLPQDALEDWSNANNVFQFVRVEDIDYDPDNPRVVYFADTGNSRLVESATTGRLWRPASGGVTSLGRIFKIVFNKTDPTKVDEFSVVLDAASVGMRNPDNVDAGSNSLMVQEDVGNAKIWRFDYGTTWTHVATVDQDNNPATSDPGESSGILDVSRWFGAGWWALDVQSHTNQSVDANVLTWSGPPGPAPGTTYQQRRENGQLLLMYVPGS